MNAKPQVVTVYTSKGGVAKTTIAALAGQYLAGMGFNVVIVDLDRQGSQTTLFDLPAQETLPDVIERRCSILESVLKIDDRMIPAFKDRESGALFVAQGGPLTTMATERVIDIPAQYDMVSNLDLLTPILNDLTGRADYVIVDMGPSDQKLAMAGLVKTDYLLMPTTMDYLSVERIEPTLREFIMAQRANPGLQLLGIVPVMTRYYFGKLRMAKNVQAGQEYLNTNFGNMVLKDGDGESVDLPYREDWPNVVWAAEPLFDSGTSKKCKDEAIRFLNAVGERLGLEAVTYE
jgi:cellulose biosynthesis protein BcsQ